MFINTNNTIYVAASDLNQLVVFSSMNSTSAMTIGTGLVSPRGLFVTIDNDIYVDNGRNHSRVEKWTSNATNGAAVMNVSSGCYSLFVDINNTLYCSLDIIPMIVKRSLTDVINTSATVAAGNETEGTSSYQLNHPNGIFVDTELTLYVADCFNHRIQSFTLNQLNGTTVAGAGAAGTVTLLHPVEIMLDGGNALFIVEYGNHRIVRSGPTGFQCILGCSGGGGSGPSQLNHPRSMAFDRDGNLFVLDTDNHRIQKFQLATDTCGKSSRLRNRRGIEIASIEASSTFQRRSLLNH